jgi:hypothetical protein
MSRHSSHVLFSGCCNHKHFRDTDPRKKDFLSSCERAAATRKYLKEEALRRAKTKGKKVLRRINFE